MLILKAARALLVVASAVFALSSTGAFGAAVSTTVLTSTPNPSVRGATVTLRAVVGSASTPTGAVTFKDGATSLGDVSVVDTIGVGAPIAAGGDDSSGHACALTAAGGVKCWGYNNRGQLGNPANAGTGTANPTALDVAGLGSGVVAIAAGVAHTCALTSAGGVKCWGMNFNGQLGNPSNTTSTVPNAAPLDVTGLASGVTAIAAAGDHTCALTRDGVVKCWGQNAYGQLGNPTDLGINAAHPDPVEVIGLGGGVLAIAAGGAHTCAVTSVGAVKCWGQNEYGQLGNPANAGISTANPQPLDVTGLAGGVVTIMAGHNHTCALTEAGAVKCWGYNVRGQLGNPANVSGNNPNPAPLDVTGLSSGVAAITAGRDHTCALTSGGAAKCWGWNFFGQLGNPTNAQQFFANPNPLDVTGLGSGVAAISAGSIHTCAVTTAGAGKCWGFNNVGQLGNGATGGVTAAPADVSSLAAMVFGRATLATAALARGVHSLTAEYGGDTDHDPSASDPLAHTVRRHPTSVAVDSSQNPSVSGQPVTFTATVSSDGGTPEGTVIFYKSGDRIAIRTLAGGVATADAALPAGTHSITARYFIDGNFAASTSPPLSQVVNKGATVTTLTVQPAAVVPGASVQLIARVDPVAPAGGRPSGTVTFKSGADTLGTVTLTRQRAVFTLDDLAIGNHALTATYDDDANFATSTSSASVAVVSPLIGAEINVTPNPAVATRQKRSPAIARLADDGFVIAWEQQSASLDRDILTRRYQPNGKPAGRQFRANSGAGRANDQVAPSVAGLTDGGFVVVWQSDQQPAFGQDIYGQRYDAAGVAAGGRFRVNTVRTSSQAEAAVAPHGDGFVVLWTSYGGAPGPGIFGKRYDSNGAPIGGEFPVTTLEEDEPHPAVAALADGGFVVTWASGRDPGMENDIYGQRYDASGAPIGIEFRVNTTQANRQQRSAVSGLDDGGFVVIWQSDDQDGDGFGIYGQRYDVAGAPVDGEFGVNTTAANHQVQPAVAGFPGGGFVVLWTSEVQDGDGAGVFGRLYDDNGAPVDGEFQVNTETAGNQGDQRVAAFPGGKFVAVWHQANAGDHAIVAQRMLVHGAGGPSPTFAQGRSGLRDKPRRPH